MDGEEIDIEVMRGILGDGFVDVMMPCRFVQRLGWIACERIGPQRLPNRYVQVVNGVRADYFLEDAFGLPSRYKDLSDFPQIRRIR